MTPTLPIYTLTHSAVTEALTKMDPGDKLVYHVGSLMHDRLLGPHFQRVHGVALAAFEAHERGEVYLVQNKIGSMEFEYIAIRKVAPRNPAKVDGKVAGKQALA